MAAVQTRGKSFSLAGGTPHLLSTAVPALFDWIDQAAVNSNKSVTDVLIKSSAIFDVRLRDTTTGGWTDVDSVPISGSLAVFSISGINIMDIEITTSSDPQTFYCYTSGETN